LVVEKMYGQWLKMPLIKPCFMPTETAKPKKRNFRSLWIMRINAGARLHGMSYSQFMGKVKANDIALNRKVLADLAMNHPEAFKAVVDQVK